MSHSHNRSGDDLQADLLTKVSAGSEWFGSLLSFGFYLGGVFDGIAGQDNDGHLLSWPGMTFGFVFSLLITTPSVYAHLVLNTNHQSKQSADTIEAPAATEATALVAPESTPKKEVTLTKAQEMALLLDAIGHMLELSSPLGFIIQICTNDQLLLWQNAISQVGTSAIGLFSSVANIRTCRNSVLASNKIKQGIAVNLEEITDPREKDFWTKSGQHMEFWIGLISNTFWLGSIIDTVFEKENDGYGLSWYGMGIGFAMAVFVSAGASYAHSILNNGHEKDPNTEKNVILNTDDVTLTWLQRIALFGDFIAHVGEHASGLTLAANAANLANTATKLTRFQNLGVQSAALLIGVLGSLANVRTCRNSMREFNMHNAAAERHKTSTQAIQ